MILDLQYKLTTGFNQTLTRSAGKSEGFSFPLKTPVLVRIENQGCPA